jgi:hypothetical protein
MFAFGYPNKSKNGKAIKAIKAIKSKTEKQ